MNLLVAWKKVLLFGAFGAVGCLAGWLVGEPYLYATTFVGDSDGAGRAPSLISKPVPPSSEPPPPSEEFQKRLKDAGANTGDVQISLIWFDTNDLDLHCVDPNGEEIYFKHRFSRSGGNLDVDRNAGCQNSTPKPVENIYWPVGKAPKGDYKVYLNFFQRCPTGPAESEWKITILYGGTREEYSGTIKNDAGGNPGPKNTVRIFSLQGRLELFAPAEFGIVPGTSTVVKVDVRREFYQGKVDIKAEGLPEGVSAEPITLQPNQTQGELLLKATDAARSGKTRIKFTATGTNVSHSIDPELAVLKSAGFSLWTVVSIGIWTALLAVGLCIALLAGQNKYLGKPLFASGRVPLALVILGASAAGFVSGSIGQSLFFVLLSLGAAKLGFLIGWVLLGALLGGGVSFFIPNLDGKKAALAGLGGGLLGALAFLMMSEVKDWIGRFGGAALLGFCIGLMVAVVEAAFRRAWLEVRFSEREVITVNLGPEPVKVGSDSRSCTVWARGAADVALKYWIRDGKVFCEDVPTRREETSLNGDTRTAGNVTVVVRTSGTAAPVAPPPAASRPPTPPVLAKPQATVAPVPAKTTAQDDYDDGLPMPMSPPPPPRRAAASILDFDDGPRPAAPAKPPVPTVAKPQAASPVPAPPKPAAPPAPAKPPVPTVAKPPAPASAPKAGDPDACPTCGRKSPGRPGARYCMVCDKTF